MTDEEIVESIIQIASSFGISCDDASYIVKSFENFGKEYMMSNIEDDIKEIKNFTKASILYGNKIGITTSQHNKLRKAMQNILSEREQNIKKIKELEEENKALELQNKQLEYYIEELKKYNKTVSDRIIEYKKNSISKQKIKEILDKAEVMDYYTLPDVIDDLTKLLEAEDE